ncbi:MAG TPA: hypothetical protein VF821_12755, partial [Lentzea sp.]
PKAQLADADRLKHEASIDSYLAKADQSAALARENAEKAAEWAAIARKAADEAAQWRDKAAASSAAAQESARQAQSYADEAQRSADQAAASAKRARDAAAQADKSANEATASAANASASASYANSKAAEAKTYADAARASAVQAGKDAAAAQAAADEAQGIANDWAKRADANQNAPDPAAEKAISPFGVERVPENVKDDTRLVSSLGCSTISYGFGAVHLRCTYKYEHHVTGTLRWFTFKCPEGATAKEQCERVEVGTSPIDMRFVKDLVIDNADLASIGLEAMVKHTIDDVYKCANGVNLGERAEACAWTFATFVLPFAMGRVAEVLAQGARIDPFLFEYNVYFTDNSVMLSSIRADGSLDLYLDVTVKRQGVASWMVNASLQHFEGRVTAINGKWLQGRMPDNLNAFNEALRAGKSFSEAALETPTGRIASKFGFSKATVDQTKLVGERGYYTNVEVRFDTWW